MLSIMSSISGNIIQPLPQTPPAPGLNTISSTSLLYFYNFETSAVSGSMLKNMITNGTNDATLVGSSLISSTTFRNGSSSLNCGSGTSPNIRFARLTTPTNFHSNTMSICFKFYLTSLSGFPCLFQILSGDGTPAGSTVVSQLQTYNGGGSTQVIRLVSYGTSNLELIISSAIQLNTWYSLAITKNGNAINTYLNGTLAASVNNGTNYPLTTNLTNNFWTSGIDFKQQTHVYSGFIDDLRIYNRVITAAESSTLHTTLT